VTVIESPPARDPAQQADALSAASTKWRVIPRRLQALSWLALFSQSSAKATGKMYKSRRPFASLNRAGQVSRRNELTRFFEQWNAANPICKDSAAAGNAGSSCEFCFQRQASEGI